MPVELIPASDPGVHVAFEAISKTYDGPRWPALRGEGPGPAGRQGRVPDPSRPVRLGKDDGADDARRVRASDCRSDFIDGQAVQSRPPEKNATILHDNMVGTGIHINAVGGDCPGKTEMHVDILQRCDNFVEYPPQTRIEGESQQLPPGYPVIELWQVITGLVPGRVSSQQTTLFKSVGFAIEDFSALRYVRDCLR